jgi:hypothetical protein
MIHFHVLYDFVPSSLSESENKLINFDIWTVVNVHTRNNHAKEDEHHTKRITPKTIYQGLALTLV